MPEKNFSGLKNKKKSGPQSKPAGVKEKVISILDIYTLISRSQYPSIAELTEHFDVSERSIYRYLEIINMIDPIEFDREKGGYKFINSRRIKKIALKDDEFLMLIVMGEAISHLGDPLKQEFRKWADNFTGLAGTPKKQLPVVIRIPNAIENEKLSGHFQTISASILERRSIDMIYHTLHSRETKERRVDPYGLVFYEGTWLFIGYCHLRNEVRTFALDRINSLRATNLYFESKDTFDIKTCLSDSWGIIYDDKKVDVTVRFVEKIAEYILRKEKWHPSEKRTILPNGEVEMTFTVVGTDEIKRWIYTWTPYVEVVKPDCLRAEIKKEMSLSAEKHS